MRQDNVPPCLIYLKSTNIYDKSNELNFPNQIKVLGNCHFDDDDSIFVGCYEFPSAPTETSISQEDFNLKDLDLEYDSIKEDVLIEASSSPHYPFFNFES